MAMIAKNIAIEGIPGAGKTTSLLTLIGELPANFILLSETNYEPVSNWQNHSINMQTDTYHQMWTKRMDYVERVSKYNKVVFLFDRSYFSNLAFKYALDYVLGTNDFERYLNLFYKDLQCKKFTLLIVLDVDPEIGYQRRCTLEEITPFPWCEKKFKEAFRTFYLAELPKLTSTPIIFINTDVMTPSEIKNNLKEILKPFKHKNTPRIPFPNKEAITANLLEFSRKYQLGKKHSDLINVFGYPTLYFQRHSIQMVNGTPVFFNNQRFSEILNTDFHGMNTLDM